MPDHAGPELYRVTQELPQHLRDWQLPPGWAWGTGGVMGEHRHFQELVDALGRSLSLVSAPDPAHARWLESEARHLAHRNHPAVPTTYHYWTGVATNGRGPGYLRRWIAGETLGARLRRSGVASVPAVLRVMREAGSAISYLHDQGATHGDISPESVWQMPMGRLWLLGWQWAVPVADVPAGLAPRPGWECHAPEWGDGWRPTPASDQWQLAALCFALLTGECPPAKDVPPVGLLRPETPLSVSEVLDRALSADPATRFPSVAAMLRAMDRVVGSRGTFVLTEDANASLLEETDEVRLRWALADDYDVLTPLGAGTFGSVWRVRDLALGREVALKLLHPHVARDERAVGRFRREAQLAAQLAHPAIVPIYDWDSRGELSWYTMELAESGSVADLIARGGARHIGEIAQQVDFVLDGLAAAHSVGIIHRDLKPENILIDRYRRWRIADFGIANAYGEELGGNTGTPAFAAPEQLLGEAQDASADCFSLAAIVAFALSGKPPFGDRDLTSILARGLAGEVDLTPFPEPIADWLRRGLAANSADRFADAPAMQQSWREAVREVVESERRQPWWRRWFAGDDATPAWGHEEMLER
jgi:eukaryotic-like serine/threonine-protein kinase